MMTATIETLLPETLELPAYPQYRPSGVDGLDNIPTNWQIKRLKFLAPKINVGLVINPSNYTTTEGVPFIFGSDVIEGQILHETARKISRENSRMLASSMLFAGDVVIVRVGAPGVTAVVGPELEGANCASIVIIRASSTYISQWLCYAMNSAFGQYQVKLVLYGAAQQQFNVSHAVNFQMLVPPIQEQQAIAAFLDRETAEIDALISKKERLIELLDERRTALISEAVTKGLDRSVPMKLSGSQWIGEIPVHWQAKCLKYESCLIQTGPFGSDLHAEDYRPGGTPIVNPAHMKNGTIVPNLADAVDEETLARLERYKLKVGDLVFARRGELGRCALVTEREDGWLCGTGSLQVRFDHQSIWPRYINYVLSTRGIREGLTLESVGSTMDNLNAKIVGLLVLAIPPLNEQKVIARYLDEETAQLNALISKVRDHIALLQERRSALITAAVTGQIDVRGLVEV